MRQPLPAPLRGGVRGGVVLRISAFNSKLTSAGGSSAGVYLWTGTENDGGKVWGMRFYDNELNAYFKIYDKTRTNQVRACLAF